MTAAENDFGPQPGEKLVFAKRLVEECAAKAKLTLELVRDVESNELSGVICTHPLADLGYDFHYYVKVRNDIKMFFS